MVYFTSQSLWQPAKLSAVLTDATQQITDENLELPENLAGECELLTLLNLPLTLMKYKQGALSNSPRILKQPIYSPHSEDCFKFLFVLRLKPSLCNVLIT